MKLIRLVSGNEECATSCLHVVGVRQGQLVGPVFIAGHCCGPDRPTEQIASTGQGDSVEVGTVGQQVVEAFVEDPAGPSSLVLAVDGQTDQQIPQRRRVQDVRVQNGDRSPRRAQ